MLHIRSDAERVNVIVEDDGPGVPKTVWSGCSNRLSAVRPRGRVIPAGWAYLSIVQALAHCAGTLALQNLDGGRISRHSDLRRAPSARVAEHDIRRLIERYRPEPSDA
jgi:hypothetical protein